MTDPIAPPPLTCSIVIRANNEERYIGRLLEGIALQTVKDVEIILVDSGSTDKTVEIATNFARQNDCSHYAISNQSSIPQQSNDIYHTLQVVNIHPEDFTFGYSLNQGIAHATRELVVIASAHVYPVYPDWLEHLLTPFADPQIGLAYGKQRGNHTTKFAEQQIFQHWYPDRSQTRQPYPFCNNANAALRRSLWEQQRYDETLPGLEDLDWGHRLMGLGKAIAYVAEAEIIHVHTETPRSVYNRYRREAMAFKHIFPQEHFRWWDLLRHFTLNAFSDLVHAARQRQLNAHLADILWFRWMQFSGTYQGYRQSGPLTWQLRQTFYYPRGINSFGQLSPRNVAPIYYNDHYGDVHRTDK
jgi:rhamnosyltransferase